MGQLPPELLARSQQLLLVNVFLVLAILGFAALVAGVLVRRSVRQRVEAERLAAMGTATARILHQIRNPLQSILLHAETLADDELVPDAGEGRSVSRSIVREANRMAELVSELSTYVGGAERPLRPEPLALAELARDVVGSTAPPAAGPALDVVADDEGLVSADPYYLRQALENLVSNACEALREAPRASGGRVQVRVRRRGATVYLAVSDDGPGMPPDRVATVLEPFVTTKGRGMGLGLPICKEIVERHGGRLTLRSRPGSGTVATMALPARPRA